MDLNRAREIVTHLTTLHLSDEWSVNYDNHVKRAGMCAYRTKTLHFSLKFAEQETEAEFTDTVIHEIAHALTIGHKHDAVWKRQARALGGTGTRTTRTQLPDEEYPWVGTCATGTHKFKYLRKPKIADQPSVRCRCGSVRNEDGKISWTHKGAPYGVQTLKRNTMFAVTDVNAELRNMIADKPAPAPPTAFPVERARGPYDRGFTNSEDIWG